jgi:hypothetical protein
MTNARRCERSHHLSGKSVRFPSYRAARDASKVQKSSARKNEVREPDQFDRYRPDLTQKIIRFFFAAKRGFLFVSRLGKRGVRVVTDVERGMRWTLAVSMRRAAWRRTAKSCGPGAPMQALSLSGDISRGDGGNQAWSPGRSRISRKPLRREGRMIRSHLWFCRVLFCCTRTLGAVGTRSSLRPLSSEGYVRCITRAFRAAGPRRLITSRVEIRSLKFAV